MVFDSDGKVNIFFLIRMIFKKTYNFMYQEIKDGRQCYIVCPLIEESDSERMEGVQSTSEVYDEVCKQPNRKGCALIPSRAIDELLEVLNNGGN